MEPMTIALLGIAALLIANLAAVLMLWLRPRGESQQSLAPLQTQLQGLSESIDRRLGEGTSRMFDSMHKLSEQSTRLAADIRDAVNKQLIEVTKGVTETKDSTKQVLTIAEKLRDLEKVLTSQKHKGNLGEQSLKLILENLLAPHPNLFQMQYSFSSGARVDAVIKAKEGMIPIDAKFPLNNYQGMINAADDATRSRFETAFKNDLQKHIGDTAKYILEPRRVCRRLQILRDWSHAESQDVPEVLGRGA